ncbi:hypothetical protein D3C86_1701630 [compost metagenome]
MDGRADSPHTCRRYWEYIDGTRPYFVQSEGATPPSWQLPALLAAEVAVHPAPLLSGLYQYCLASELLAVCTIRLPSPAGFPNVSQLFENGVMMTGYQGFRALFLK